MWLKLHRLYQTRGSFHFFVNFDLRSPIPSIPYHTHQPLPSYTVNKVFTISQTWRISRGNPFPSPQPLLRSDPSFIDNRPGCILLAGNCTKAGGVSVSTGTRECDNTFWSIYSRKLVWSICIGRCILNFKICYKFYICHLALLKNSNMIFIFKVLKTIILGESVTIDALYICYKSVL